jgi:hypothetical protein
LRLQLHESMWKKNFQQSYDFGFILGAITGR